MIIACTSVQLVMATSLQGRTYTNSLLVSISHNIRLQLADQHSYLSVILQLCKALKLAYAVRLKFTKHHLVAVQLVYSVVFSAITHCMCILYSSLCLQYLLSASTQIYIYIYHPSLFQNPTYSSLIALISYFLHGQNFLRACLSCSYIASTSDKFPNFI